MILVPGQVITAVMTADPDPAAVFACAVSLRDACMEREKRSPTLNLSEAYNGYDQLLREVMRIGTLFEEWVCGHVVFEVCGEVWPYFMEDRFGDACMEVLAPDELAGFDSDDCLRVAMELRVPLRVDGELPVPFMVEVDHPAEDSGFRRLRIETRRERLDEERESVPFRNGDEPFDEELGPVCFGIDGVGPDGTLHHIADRLTYRDARELLVALVPGIELPEEAVSETWRRKD
ncbi:MAG: hypothetical protein KDN05_11460 [Verrucomicrobiae bacterium]|nr:hypothetical protein [Verrucomicrobiae bacterium]